MDANEIITRIKEVSKIKGSVTAGLTAFFKNNSPYLIIKHTAHKLEMQANATSTGKDDQLIVGHIDELFNFYSKMDLTDQASYDILKEGLAEFNISIDHPCFAYIKYLESLKENKEILPKDWLDPYNSKEELVVIPTVFFDQMFKYFVDTQIEEIKRSLKLDHIYNQRLDGYVSYIHVPPALFSIANYFSSHSLNECLEQMPVFSNDGTVPLASVMAEVCLQHYLQGFLKEVSWETIQEKYPLKLIEQDRLKTFLGVLISNGYDQEYFTPQKTEEEQLFEKIMGMQFEEDPDEALRTHEAVMSRLMDHWTELVQPLSEKDLSAKSTFFYFAMHAGVEKLFNLLKEKDLPWYTHRSEEECVTDLEKQYEQFLLNYKEIIFSLNMNINHSKEDIEGWNKEFPFLKTFFAKLKELNNSEESEKANKELTEEEKAELEKIPKEMPKLYMEALQTIEITTKRLEYIKTLTLPDFNRIKDVFLSLRKEKTTYDIKREIGEAPVLDVDEKTVLDLGFSDFDF